MPSNEAPSTEQTGSNELEQGIFGFVITWTQALAADIGDEAAREVVAAYLDKLSNALRTLDEKASE